MTYLLSEEFLKQEFLDMFGHVTKKGDKVIMPGRWKGRYYDTGIVKHITKNNNIIIDGWSNYRIPLCLTKFIINVDALKEKEIKIRFEDEIV